MTYRILVQSRRKPGKWYEMWRGEDADEGRARFCGFRRVVLNPVHAWAQPPALLLTNDPSGQVPLLHWKAP